MNGSLHTSPDVVEINLKRGPSGLGFNIVGGVDQQYVMNDSGIYVSKIKEDGAAALDGRLQEGDKIVEINGVSLENKMHKDVVELFKKAGEDVELRVMKKLPDHKKGSKGSSSLPFMGIVAILVGAAAIFAFYMRQSRRHF